MKISEKIRSRMREDRLDLKGTVIVFVTAGYSGKKFIFEKAKELGVRSVVIDDADSWSFKFELAAALSYVTI